MTIDPTKCTRCGAVPRAAIHHDKSLDDFHGFVRLTIVDNRERGRVYWFLAGAAVVGAALVAAVKLFGS